MYLATSAVAEAQQGLWMDECLSPQAGPPQKQHSFSCELVPKSVPVLNKSHNLADLRFLEPPDVRRRNEPN